MTGLLAGALLALAASGEEPRTAVPDPKDLAAARTAWSYFERNSQPATGLVSSVEGYPSTTMWDLGSSILAAVAARDLGVLEGSAFDARVGAMLRTLAVLPLFESELPNKAYDAASGAMTDYANHPAPRGIGFSAIDLGRLASALEVLVARYPTHAAAAARAVERWQVCRLASGGELHGALRDASGEVKVWQEGRLGYEQYAARALERLGLDVSQARRADRFAAAETIEGLRVMRDERVRRTHGAVDALVSEPWVLDALEHGPDAALDPLRAGVFQVQKRRWESTGIVTARSEDHIDRAPWFIYGAIWADGAPWRTVNDAGQDVSKLAALSTKAAFGLAVLYPEDPYARVLLEAVSGTNAPGRGWYAGTYEAGGTNHSLNANTNAVILEALRYRALGPFLRLSAADGPASSGAGSGTGSESGALREVGARAASACAALAPSAASASGSGGGLALGAPSLVGASPRPFRIDGTAYTGWRGLDRGLAGAVATAWPWRFTFLRLGGEVTPASPGGSSRLLWGLGWDDWHPSTFFLHVDNWGPIRPSDGLATRQAELNAGYRLPRWCATRWLCADPVAAVTTPFAGGPYVTGRVHLTIAGDWFLMGGIGHTVPGVLTGPQGTPDWRVVYGLGRWSWKPGSVFLTYFDWGPDSRQGNGILALGVNWAF